jgi:hypothetical protein
VTDSVYKHLVRKAKSNATGPHHANTRRDDRLAGHTGSGVGRTRSHKSAPHKDLLLHRASPDDHEPNGRPSREYAEYQPEAARHLGDGDEQHEARTESLALPAPRGIARAQIRAGEKLTGDHEAKSQQRDIPHPDRHAANIARPFQTAARATFSRVPPGHHIIFIRAPVLLTHIAQVCSGWTINHLVKSKPRHRLAKVLEEASPTPEQHWRQGDF